MDASALPAVAGEAYDTAITAPWGGMAQDQRVTTEAVARWMADRVAERGVLDQAAAAERIGRSYGQAFVHENANGTRAIAKPVLAAFRKLTAATVVWDQSIQAWRLRAPDDPPARRQAE